MVRRALGLLVVSFSLGACAPTSFTLRGRVTSCADDTPLEGAGVGLQTMKPAVDMFNDTSASDGSFGFKVTNVPKESPATLTVQLSGYQTVEKKYEGAPSGAETICLRPTRR